MESGFATQPRAKFEWECLNMGTIRTSNFILDSGSQLNMLKFEEVEKLGFKLEDLNTIYLQVNGISGSLKDAWYRFRVNLKSTVTNMEHFEEFYVSTGISENLIS